MANYYTMASAGVYPENTTAEALQAFVDEVNETYDFDPEWGYTPFEISVETAIDGTVFLWFRHDESIDINAAADTICEAMKRFNVEGSVDLGYACICDKPRMGEFGGGLIKITKKGIEWNT